MGRISMYVSEYKHLGPLQIIIKEKTTTVISILGIRSFSFSRLPSCRNNKYTILKLALRGYFNIFIENYTAPEKAEVQDKPKEGGIFGFIMNFITTMALESPDPIFALKGRIAKDLKLFDWEDVQNFVEIESWENILDLIKIPILVRFQGFATAPVSDEKTLAVSERDVLRLKVQHKTIERSEREKVFRNFVASEIASFGVLKSYPEPCFKEVVGVYEKICEGLSLLLCSEKASSEDSEKASSEDIVLPSPPCDHSAVSVDESVGSPDEISSDNQRPTVVSIPIPISSADIARVYLDHFDLLDCYFRFIRDFESVDSADYDLKMRMTNALAKLTGYSKIFSNICEMEDTTEARTASLKFYRMSKLLNELSERLHLESLGSYRAVVSKAIKATENDEILGSITCADPSGRLSYTFVLTSSALLVVGSKNTVLLASQLSNAMDIFSYTGYVYLTVPYDPRSKLSALEIECISSTPVKRSILAFRSFDREVSENFCEKFYQAKYKCRMIKNFFYTTEKETEADREFGGVIVVSGISDLGTEDDTGVFRCKIEDHNFRVGGIGTYGYDELLERISEKVEAKRLERMNTRPTLNIISSVIKHAGLHKTRPFVLDSYLDDAVCFRRKEEIFTELCTSILSTDSAAGPRYSIEEVTQVLQEIVIVENETAEYVREFNKMYYGLLLSSAESTMVPASTALEDNLILLCMLVRRNLYYFFDSEDLERVIASGHLPGGASWLKAHTARYSERLSSVAGHLALVSSGAFREMLLRAVFIV